MSFFKKNQREVISTVLVCTAVAAIVIFSVSSCGSSTKPENTKDIAEESNKEKNNGENLKKDADFLVDAAEINLEEIKLGQLAQQNSLMPEVKELGTMMETEHTKCLSDLKALADKKSITIPTSITTKGENAYEKLLNKSGAEFDKEYCDMMVNGHKDAIAKFEKASTDCADADVRAWAMQTLPALQKHLDHALSCQKNCSKKM